MWQRPGSVVIEMMDAGGFTRVSEIYEGVSEYRTLD